MMSKRRFLVTPPRDPQPDEERGAPVCDVLAAVGTPRSAAAAAREPGGTPTALIRSALRALASETGMQTRLDGVRHLRPLVAQAHEILRERLEAGGTVEDYVRGRARLADSAVVGLLHVASLRSGVRGNGMVAPLAAVAVGGYGRRELAPCSDLDLLFLLPEQCRPRAGEGTAATVACVNTVVAGLWDLGFTLDHAARSSQECLDLAREEPSVLAGLLDRRFLWGEHGLFAALDAGLANFFSGPNAARWRRAVAAALASNRRDASREKEMPEDAPDVKRDPGGLRDLQRALSANPLASGRPTALSDPTLIEAHRFLWLVRCHLHLLAGHAEDRLIPALQPGVARRLGLDEPGGTSAVPRLLSRFRRHAQNVLQATRAATASTPLLPSIEAPWNGC